MYQIIVVDDKKAIRQGLEKHIPWEKLGYQLAGTASSAQEAIQLIESNCIDVLLTDIVMPDMTGLELIYFAKLINPDIKVIILSAYDRFDYAQRAISLGAQCYLTKPVDLEELQKELLSLKQALEEADRARRQNRLLMEVAREQFFDQLLSEKWAEDQEIRNRAAQLQLSFGAGNFVVLAAETHPGEISSAEVWDSLSAFLLELGEVTSLETKEHAVVYLLFARKQLPEEELARFCAARKDARLSIGISSPYFNLTMIATAYKEAQKALEFRIMQKQSSVFYYPRIRTLFQKSGELSPEQEQELIGALSEGRIDLLQQALRQILREKSVAFAPDSPGDIYVTIISLINHYMEQSIGTTEQDADETRQLIRTILSKRSAEEMTQYLMEYTEHCFARLHSNRRTVSNQIVERAMAYIREHYSEDITLKKLSEEVYVNPMYLSRLFKEKAGISYIDYLTEIRIDNAKRLLNDLSLRIYDIAEMVGYESRKHFGKIFKDHTGMSPKEYRNALSA